MPGDGFEAAAVEGDEGLVGGGGGGDGGDERFGGGSGRDEGGGVFFLYDDNCSSFSVISTAMYALRYELCSSDNATRNWQIHAIQQARAPPVVIAHISYKFSAIVSLPTTYPQRTVDDIVTTFPCSSRHDVH